MSLSGESAQQFPNVGLLKPSEITNHHRSPHNRRLSELANNSIVNYKLEAIRVQSVKDLNIEFSTLHFLKYLSRAEVHAKRF